MKHELSLYPVISEHTDFDQAVRIKRKLSFFDNGGADAVVSYHDDRIEMVRVGAVNFAFSRSQLDGRHGGIIFFH